LLELIDRRETYWGSGTQGGRLCFTELVGNTYLDRSPELLVDYHVDHGFMFQWAKERTSSTDDREFWIALNKRPSLPNVAVEIFCQTSWWFPSTAFVDPETAKQVVTTYVRSKGRSRSRAVVWRLQTGYFSEPDTWKQFVT
jgi:hypothetical protein